MGNESKTACVLCSAAAYCCGAVAPRAIAALLGRFLPRLGPLVHSSGPFFFLGFGRTAKLATLRERTDYFSDVFTEVNFSLRFVPRPLTTAMIAREMPAAIRPYSIAVAPDSSDKNFEKTCFNSTSKFWVWVPRGEHGFWS